MNDSLKEIFYSLDSITFNHSVRVMRISLEVEKFFAFHDHLLSDAALLHDIGKVFVSSKILDKKTMLSSLERNLVDLHPYIGYRILRDHDVDEDICRVVLYHHGNHPPMLENIEPSVDDRLYDVSLMLHSIDSFEALTSDRPYHRCYLADEALDIMLHEYNHHQGFLDYLITQAETEESKRKSAVFRSNCIQEVNVSDRFIYGFKEPLRSAVNG